MPWAKFDDRFNSHPKVLAAGPLAVALHMRAIIYSALHLTDGVIRRRALNHILAWDDDADDFAGNPPSNLELAKRLVNAGLWEEATDGAGWAIHDYLDWNPSKARLAEMSEARSAAGRKAGLASGASRRDKGRSRGRTNEQRTNDEPNRSRIVRESFDCDKGDETPETTRNTGESERTNGEPNRSHVVRNRSSIVRNRSRAEPDSGRDTRGDRAQSFAEPRDTTDISGAEPAGNLSESSRTNGEPNRSQFVEKSLNDSRTKMNPVPVPVPIKNKEKEDHSAELDAPQQPGCIRTPVVVSIPLVSGEHSVSQADVDEWTAAYPSVDVMQELQAMRQWSLANPRKRKTERGAARFIASWLNRQQSNPRNQRGKTTFADLTAAAMEWAREGDEQDGVRRPDVATQGVLPERDF